MKAQVDLLTSAKQGDLQALEALMNKPLAPKGIVVSLEVKNHCLTVTAEAAVNPPSKHSLISFVKQGLDNIMPAGISSVMVHGKVQGLSSIDWYQHFSLRSEPESFVSPEPTDRLYPSPFVARPSEHSLQVRPPAPRVTQPVPHLRQFLLATSVLLGALLAANIVGLFMPQRMARTQWEYRVMTLEDDDFSAAMETVGQDGWEISYARRAIASDSDTEYTLYELILKRPK